MKKVDYYYVIMSQKSLLENQVIEEILRERATYYSIKNRIVDFWILISPEFVYSKEILNKIHLSNFFIKNKKDIIFSEFTKNKNREFYCSLISTDKEFLQWFKLRVGYFEDINKLEKNNFVSDGVMGIISTTNEENFSILKSNPNILNPSILLNKYKKSLELYIDNQK